jgi:hypothetical protein
MNKSHKSEGPGLQHIISQKFPNSSRAISQVRKTQAPVSEGRELQHTTSHYVPSFQKVTSQKVPSSSRAISQFRKS